MALCTLRHARGALCRLPYLGYKRGGKLRIAGRHVQDGMSTRSATRAPTANSGSWTVKGEDAILGAICTSC